MSVKAGYALSARPSVRDNCSPAPTRDHPKGTEQLAAWTRLPISLPNYSQPLFGIIMHSMRNSCIQPDYYDCRRSVHHSTRGSPSVEFPPCAAFLCQRGLTHTLLLHIPPFRRSYGDPLLLDNYFLRVVDPLVIQVILHLLRSSSFRLLLLESRFSISLDGSPGLAKGGLYLSFHTLAL